MVHLLAGSSPSDSFFRGEWPEDLRHRLATFPDEAPFNDPAAVENLLGGRLRENRWLGRVVVVPPGNPAGQPPGLAPAGKE